MLPMVEREVHAFDQRLVELDRDVALANFEEEWVVRKTEVTFAEVLCGGPEHILICVPHPAKLIVTAFVGSVDAVRHPLVLNHDEAVERVYVIDDIHPGRGL